MIRKIIDFLLNERYHKRMNQSHKLVIVEHTFEGEDKFWDSLMDKNQFMTITDCKAEKAFSGSLIGEVRC
jgi:hypothetical protein